MSGTRSASDALRDLELVLGPPDGTTLPSPPRSASFLTAPLRSQMPGWSPHISAQDGAGAAAAREEVRRRLIWEAPRSRPRRQARRRPRPALRPSRGSRAAQKLKRLVMPGPAAPVKRNAAAASGGGGASMTEAELKAKKKRRRRLAQRPLPGPT